MERYLVFYNQEQLGPMSLDEIVSKNFPVNTLVWKEGMDNWQPLINVLQNKTFPPTPKRTSHYVPSFNNNYASFWHRLAAYFIDSFIFTIFYLILNLIVSFAYRSVIYSTQAIGYYISLFLISIIGSWIYYAYFESSEYQATPGKKLLRIKVVDSNSNRISFETATKRFFSKILSGLILFIGYLMVLWNPKKQALHDQIADTYIIME